MYKKNLWIITLYYYCITYNTFFLILQLKLEIKFTILVVLFSLQKCTQFKAIIQHILFRFKNSENKIKARNALGFKTSTTHPTKYKSGSVGINPKSWFFPTNSVQKIFHGWWPTLYQNSHFQRTYKIIDLFSIKRLLNEILSTQNKLTGLHKTQ